MRAAGESLTAMASSPPGGADSPGRIFMSHTNWWVTVILVAMAALVVSPAIAAGPGATDNPSMTDRPASTEMFLQSNKIIDARVQNTSGEKLGTIEDIVLCSDHRMVLYTVLSHGGAMGIHEKYFAVPWSALTVQTKEGKIDYLVLDVSKDTLNNSQGFDHKNWPVHADTTLFKAAAESSDKAAMGSEAGNSSSITKFQKVSQLTGLSVSNQQKESLGDIECLLIEQEHGKAQFALVSYGGVLGVGEKFSPVPWQAIEIQPEQHMAMLNADRSKLDSLSFVMKDYPNFSDRQYRDRIFQTYNIQPGRVAAEPKEASFDAWKADSDYNKKFDASKVTTIEGTVQSVGSFHIGDSAPGLRIRVQTEKQDVLLVHAGPCAFAKSKNFNLASGDKISVTGSQIEHNGRTILMASEIKKGNDTLTLRDSSGKVQWDVNELQKMGTESEK